MSRVEDVKRIAEEINTLNGSWENTGTDEDVIGAFMWSVMGFVGVVLSTFILVTIMGVDKELATVVGSIVGFVVIMLGIFYIKRAVKIVNDSEDRYNQKLEEIEIRIKQIYGMIRELPVTEFKVEKIRFAHSGDIAIENVHQIREEDENRTVTLKAILVIGDTLREIGGQFIVKVDESLSKPVFAASYIGNECKVDGEVYEGYYNGVLKVPNMSVIE